MPGWVILLPVVLTVLCPPPINQETMMARSSKKPSFSPETLAQANKLLTTLGTLEREIMLEQAVLAEQISSLQAASSQRMAPLARQKKETLAALKTLATAYKKDLFPPEKKSVVLACGELGWRKTPDRVVIARGQDETVLALLCAEETYAAYVRQKPEINKEALLDAKPTIPGISYGSTERFFANASTKEPDTVPA